MLNEHTTTATIQTISSGNQPKVDVRRRKLRARKFIQYFLLRSNFAHENYHRKVRKAMTQRESLLCALW